jgi:hypothetical protein
VSPWVWGIETTFMVSDSILEACHTGAAAQALYCWSAAPTDLLGQPGTISGLSLDIAFETLVTFLVQVRSLRPSLLSNLIS